MGKLRLKGSLLLVVAVLVLFHAMQVAMCQRERERELPEEEGRRAQEEEWRRREKTAAEERRRRRRWEEEEEERGRPPRPRRREWEEEEEEEREQPPRPRRREWEEEEEEEERGRGPPHPIPVPGGGGGGEELFILRDSKRVVSTEAGEMRVVRGYGGRMVEKPLHIGFITMEPRSLFIPQYLDSSLVMFLRRGEAQIGLIYKDQLAERQLRMGDVYRIPAGSTFYIVNTGETQRLHIVCSIDPSEGLGLGTFQSFFVGGGANPVSVLAGFDAQTLSTAFNVSIGELRDLMTGQQTGPIVYADTTHAPGLWANFLKLKEKQRLERLKKVAPDQGFDERDEEEQSEWSWRKLLDSVLGSQDNKKGRGDRGGDTRTGSGPETYNLYDRDPDFRNDYGWSIALDKHEYGPLKKSGIGIYLVNLTAGSMMAPHVNPTATEYGIVLAGSGTIQVVFPNGTSAMNTQVEEGDVFWIPRYFPFCQIASRTGPFEFFGFTTSAHRNRPQFLVGASSILRTMRGPEFATAFGLTEDRFRDIVDAQREAVILPSPAAAPPDHPTSKGERKKGSEGGGGEKGSQEKRSEGGEKGSEEKPSEGGEKGSKGEKKKGLEMEKMPKFMRSLGAEMVMGFE